MVGYLPVALNGRGVQLFLHFQPILPHSKYLARLHTFRQRRHMVYLVFSKFHHLHLIPSSSVCKAPSDPCQIVHGIRRAGHHFFRQLACGQALGHRVKPRL
ncbi:MAG: hypothetical protein OXC66_05210 [Roseovarius sp.]|nr:hypothetical protein [Roseovarius sp.]